MRIVSIYIHSFGRLNNFTHNFKDGLNVICEENGFGKSTIAAFVKAMLFGLKASGNSSLENDERRLYCPWNAIGKFGGSMTIEFKNKQYRIERMFGDTPKSDTTPTVVDCTTGKPTQIFGTKIGEAILKLNAEDFERCLYIPQKSVSLEKRDNFRERINEITENTDGANSFAAAITKLDKYVSVKKKELAQARDEIERIEKEKRTATENEKEIQNLKSGIKGHTQSLADANAQHQLLKSQLDNLDKQKIYTAEFRRLEDIQRDLSANEAEISRLQKTFPDGVPDESTLREVQQRIEQLEKSESRQSEVAQNLSKPKPLPLILSVGCAFLAVLFGILAGVQALPPIVGIILTVLMAALAAFGVYLNNLGKKKIAEFAEAAKKRTADLKKDAEEKEQIKKVLGATAQNGTDLRIALERTRLEAEKLCNAKARRQELLKRQTEAQGAYTKEELETLQATQIDFSDETNLKQRCSATYEKINQLTRELAQMETKLDGLVEEFVSVNELLDKLAVAKETESMLLKKQSNAKTAKEALSQAKDSLSASFLPAMQKSLKDTFGRLASAKRYSDIFMDTDFNVSVVENGAAREIEFLSTGLTQVCLFSLRMAVVDTMFKDENVFVLLDDPFVNLDDNKFSEACTVLRERAKKSQVIYLTCRKANGDALLKI